MQTNKECRRQLPLLLLGAVLTAFPLICPQFGILEWGSMIPLLYGLYRLAESGQLTLRRAYGYGFLTVYVFYFVIYHWFVNLYPLDFVGMDNASSAAVIAAGWLGLPLLQAIPGGFVFWIYALLNKRRVFARMPLLQPVLFAALWVIFEWSSTLGWTGVPWGRLALGQVKLLPLLQSASLLGSYFVSFLIVLVNGLLAYALVQNKKAVLCGGLAAVLFFSNLAFGAVRMLLPVSSDNTLRVAVIQGNINSHEKWGSDSYQKTKEAYGNLTREAARNGAELVVWPETAFPYDLSYNNRVREFICDLAAECNVTLIVGGLYDTDDGKSYNALFLIEADGSFREEFYAKRHLVPFGEYVPMRNVIMTLIPPLAELSALGDDISAGEDSALFQTQWGEIGSLICFDSIYEELTLESVRDGAALLVVSSNDSWFYDSAAVYQHESQSVLRAVEGGRDVVRAANTGISSVITHTGKHLAWIDPLTEGYRVADVSVRSQKTLYTVIGNTFVYLCAASVLGAVLYGFLKKNKKEENEPTV